MSVLKKYMIVLLLSGLFSPLFSGEGKTPLRKMKYTTRTADKAKEWQKELRKELFQILKLDEVPRHEVPPGRALPMCLGVAVILQEEQVVVALPVERDEVCCNSILRRIEYVHLILRCEDESNSLAVSPVPVKSRARHVQLTPCSHCDEVAS